MKGNGIERITYGMVQYPALLTEIKDPPKELFYAGDISLLKKRCAAVVGSRKTTQYGRSIASEIAGKLAQRDVAVVSGMAKGIDTCAHQGALDAGGTTIAVLGCGVDICYPKDNVLLKRKIEENGLVISEYPPGSEPKKYNFPQRNRIISGLSELTVVVQAGNRSGALITAEFAAEQGREICAVPGNIDSRYNMGNNKLIKEGVYPIVNTSDILEIMGLEILDRNTAERVLGEEERRIYDLLETNREMTIDELCLNLSKPPAYIASITAVMEMKGIVFSALGKIFIAKG